MAGDPARSLLESGDRVVADADRDIGLGRGASHAAIAAAPTLMGGDGATRCAFFFEDGLLMFATASRSPRAPFLCERQCS